MFFSYKRFYNTDTMQIFLNYIIEFIICFELCLGIRQRS